jgi:hypothetical protein
VLAEKDGDRAIFAPASHNHWAFGVDYRSPQRAEEISAATFLFSAAIPNSKLFDPKNAENYHSCIFLLIECIIY